MCRLSPAQLAQLIAMLEDLFPNEEVWAFGSRIRDKHKPYSDLDLAVVGEVKLSFPRYLHALNVMEESDLPFRIDLLDYRRVKPGFQEIIRKEHVVVFPLNGRSPAEAVAGVSLET